jgi:Zn-dependent peptidase ImmA (M78 family)
MPDRALDYAEAKVIAEAQANRLLDLLELTSPPFDTDFIANLPRLDVKVVPSLPSSGMSHWSHGRWQIRINGAEAPVRQRFTLAHEFKHLLDAPFEEVIYRGLRKGERSPLVEAVCDHFAACLLMPKKWVKRSFYGGLQDPAELAWRFDVSPQAMSYRLTTLGILDPGPRCEGVRLVRQNRRPSIYFRTAPSRSRVEPVLVHAGAS